MRTLSLHAQLLPQIAEDVHRLAGPQHKLFAPPGHYYSPIPDVEELKRRWSSLSLKRNVEYIDLRASQQRKLAEEVLAKGRALGFPEKQTEDWRYYCDNWMFGRADATVLAGMLCAFLPRRVVEIGSGFSTAVMLDVRERQYASFSLTSIEPYPDRLRSLLRPSDTNHQIVELPVQDVNLSLFDELGEGDFLFIDSTHVSKTGSDVNFEFFEVLPRLKSGVIIHLHDIFYPFEYPENWAVHENRAWNELYLLRSFLMYNPSYEILLWPHMLLAEGHEGIASLATGTGSLWLRKK